MEVIFFITLFLYLFVVGACTDFVDYDFFARLIVGKTYFQTGDVLKYDFLSYSKTHPWYDHEWGASVIFYFIQDRFGDIGLLIFKTLCLFGAFFFLVSIIKLRRKYALDNSKDYGIFNFLFFFIMLQPLGSMIFSLRCHHFTFFFFAIWLYVLEKARLEKNYRILWALPLLMVVWSNIHGGCFMALGVTGIYAFGEFLRKKPFLPYIYTLLASCILMFINPYGFDYVKFLFEATTMHRPNIVEWQPPFGKLFLTKLIKFKLILIGFMALSIFNFCKAYKNSAETKWLSKIKEIFAKMDKTKVLLIFVMFLLSLKSMRFISYLVFVLIPFCYDDFYSIFNKRLKDSHNRIKELIIFWFILFVFLLNITIAKIGYKDFHTIYPISEIEYLIENNVKGNVLVPFEVGSYSAYKLYPNNFILQDGRYEEVYELDTNDDYAKAISIGLLGWEDKLDSIHHDVIIPYKYYALYENLKYHPDYFLVMESRTFALFIRKDVYYKIKQPDKIPTSNPEYYEKILWNTNINWLKK